MDGMFTFIDPKMTPILGYLPQELTGSSVYEHVLYDDIPGLVEGHRKALKVKEEVKVAPVKFRYSISICFYHFHYVLLRFQHFVLRVVQYVFTVFFTTCSLIVH